MSIDVMSMVWKRYPGEGNELLVALAIADWVNDNGEGMFASLAKLAQKSRQSESSARRHLQHMVKSGWLKKVNNGTGGRGVTTEYRISPEWLKGVNLTPFPVEPVAGSSTPADTPLEPQLDGSSSPENPTSRVVGNQSANPSNLTPFHPGNPAASDRVSSQRVSNRPEKGVTAMTPDPLEPKNSGARAPARERARATRETEPQKPLDPTVRRGYWRSRIVNDMVAEIWDQRHEFNRQPVTNLPTRVQQLVEMTTNRILETWGTAEPTAATEESVTLEARSAGRDIHAWYTEACAA